MENGEWRIEDGGWRIELLRELTREINRFVQSVEIFRSRDFDGAELGEVWGNPLGVEEGEAALVGRDRDPSHLPAAASEDLERLLGIRTSLWIASGKSLNDRQVTCSLRCVPLPAEADA